MAAILLDLDGTLTDPGLGIERCLRHALSALGREPPHIDLARAVGPPLREVLGPWLAGAPEETIDEAIRLYRQRYATCGWVENTVYPGVLDLLEGIRARGWRATVVTSKLEPIAVRIVEHFALAPYLTGVYGTRPGELGAKPDLIARVLACEAIDPAEAVVVGDRLHDVPAASTRSASPTATDPATSSNAKEPPGSANPRRQSSGCWSRAYATREAAAGTEVDPSANGSAANWVHARPR
jgi:phosphoglycolate phosphatase